MSNYELGSLVFRYSDRLPMTYQTDYRAAYRAFNKEELGTTRRVVPAGGTQVVDSKTGEAMTADEFARHVHVDLGHHTGVPVSDSAALYVRHPQEAYDHPVQSVDPSNTVGGLASTNKWTLSTYDPDTGEVREVPKVKSAVDFGHAPPHVQSLHRQDYVAHKLGEGHTMTAAERMDINLAINKAKFVLGYEPKNMQTTYQAGCKDGLAAKPGAVPDKPWVPRDDPTYTNASEFSKRVHVRLGYEARELSTVERDAYVRHPQAAYDNPVCPVDPSALAGRVGSDPSKLDVTTLTGVVKQVDRVKSAVDFGHEAPHYVSIVMGAQHTAAPTLTRRLGAGTSNGFHCKTYVPAFRNIKFAQNESHPALARQAQLEAADAAAAEETAFETAVLGATLFDNKDVTLKVRYAGMPPPSMAATARVQAVVDKFGGQTLSPKEKAVPSPTQTLRASIRAAM